MWPRLLLQQRIDRPTTIKPDVETLSLQVRKEGEDAGRVHVGLRLSSVPGWCHARMLGGR